MIDLSFIRVVLSNPRSGKNVGAVCRAMKNMGLSRLYLIGAEGLNFEDAGVTAIHAADILQNAVACPDLETALAGTVLSAALSRRRGKKRKYFSIFPAELARRLAALGALNGAASSPAEAALVFGNEASGLCEEEMALCNLAVLIPSSEAFPSLNLSHAVQIVAYEIYKTAREREAEHLASGYDPINREELSQLCAGITADLGRMGFFTQTGPEEMERFFRDILARSFLSRREAERLKNIFAKAAGLCRSRIL
ncbi:MAG: RNA methyltransferase [Spirochaetales bacterium]|jgi:TrmH family RNA methyltransferase|nr:RNA methyltransferase [Spirochaetales bacterium]